MCTGFSLTGKMMAPLRGGTKSPWLWLSLFLFLWCCSSDPAFVSAATALGTAGAAETSAKTKDAQQQQQQPLHSSNGNAGGGKEDDIQEEEEEEDQEEEEELLLSIDDYDYDDGEDYDAISFDDDDRVFDDNEDCEDEDEDHMSSLRSERELKPVATARAGANKKKPPCFKKQSIYDVIIVGAGAAGAGAARELYKWNKMAPKNKNKMNYLVLEATKRMGGRIYDVEFGKGHDPDNDKFHTEGVWGGFNATGRNYASTSYTTPPINIGCNCDGTPAVPSEKDEEEPAAPHPPGCERITVEAGAWRFQGDRGIKTSCNDLFDDETGEYWEGEMTINENCINVHPNINRLYALSQGPYGGSEEGGLPANERLNVRCDFYDTTQTYTAVSNETQYYNVDITKSHYYDTEYGMELVDTSRQFLPLVNTNSTKGRVTDFMTELDDSISKCVDPAGTAIYNRWYYTNNDDYDYDYSTPGNYPGSIGPFNKSWTIFDQTYNTVPDFSVVDWKHGGNKYEREKKRFENTKWCKQFSKLAQSYLLDDDNNDPETTKMHLRAQQWSETHNRWSYDSGSLAYDVSFADFYDGPPPWTGNYNTVIDHRGISTLIESIMPPTSLIKNKKRTGRIKYKTRVTKIDYSGTHCGCKRKVMITAIVKNKKKYYCAKKVLSTVSMGVMKKKKLFKPSIQQQALRESPYTDNGSLIKVFLRFPDKFWDDNTLMTTYIMTNDFRANQTDQLVRGNIFYSIDYLRKNNPSIVKEYNTSDTSTTLLCFIASPDWEMTGLEKRQKKLTNDYIGEKIWQLLDPLREQYGSTYQDPNCFFYYNWGSDPNFYGAYPVWRKGASLLDHEEFYTPLTVGGKKDAKPVVWLSGESSCAYHYGTMSGAYEAGSRDGRSIIKLHIGKKLAEKFNIHTFSACGTQRGLYEDYCLAPPW